MPDIVPMVSGGISAIQLAARRRVLLPALTFIATAAPASDLPPPMPDGRMLGHLPYSEAARIDLVAAPPGFALGLPCLVHRDVAPDLARLLTAASLAPGVGKALRGVSCFRAIAHQRSVFCRNAQPGICGDLPQRARFVGPPGYSEHATGYAIDFGVRPSSPGCADVDACVSATAAGRWLLAHAADYGFELSFPNGNAQGVTWEPWHWRWVGAHVNVPGAARARLAFARARASYPASPGVMDVSDAWLTASAPAVRPAIADKFAVMPPAPLLDPAASRGTDLRR
jgi:D-alanyl-D-alanine carboxypeptidase